MDACLEKFNPSQLNGCLTVDKRPSFLSVFTEAVEKNPSKEAIIFHDDNGLTKSISFQRFNDASSRIANFLKRYHDSKKLGSKVIGVALKPSEQLPVILLAILKAGMTYLPLDLEAPHRRIKYILQEACPAICIIEDKEETEKFSDADVLTSENLISGATLESNVVSSEIDDSKIALVLYTSGSTGFPKGVTLPYTALMNRLYWQWKELPYSPTEKYCVFKTALTFVDSICEIWGPLLQSRTLIVLPKHVIQNPEKFINVLKKYEIQRIVLVPSLLSTIMVFLRYQQDKKSLSSLNLWICSGETISTSLAKDFFTWFEDDNKTIANLYGSTEIMGDVTFYLINKNDIYLNKKTLPIGKPIDNCIVYVVDENLELVSYGETGEILVAGRNLATGYISSSSIQNKFIKNPFPSSQGYVKAFRTGDLARIENSLIFYEGRQDSQIKIRGQKIDLTEIDRAILEISSVEAVVTCCKIYEHQQIILSFIVLKNFNSNEEDIELHLKQTLLSYMMPKIILVQEFPLLTNGKVDRQKLLKSYESTDDQNQCDYSNVPNEYMKKAKVLFPLLSSVIGHHNKCISIRSNFYELGGNSLNSVYTVSKLREKGFNIGITDFITAESIMDILKKMKKGGSFNDDDINPNQYIIELLSDSHKNEVIKIITESFIAKADLERWLLPEIQEKDYNDFIECLWKPLLDKKFSFVIKSSLDDKILSVALNFDARDEPDIKINSKLSIIFDFLESLEQPVRDRHLPQGKNKIFHSFMMATDISLSSATNVILMRIMEQKCLEIANQNNFSGILTTNTSPLTQGTELIRVSKFHHECKQGKFISYIHENVRTLYDSFRKGAKESNDGQCLGWRSGMNTPFQWLHYNETLLRAKNFGSGIISCCINSNDKKLIGIYSQNCPEWILTEQACYTYSMIVVPLNDTLGSDACAFIIQQAELALIVCEDDKKCNFLLDQAPGCLQTLITIKHITLDTHQKAKDKGIKIFTFDYIERQGSKKSQIELPPKSTDLCTICYTSGTTGQPKGVMLTHRNVMAGICAVLLQLGDYKPTSLDTMISYLPLSYMLERCCENGIYMVGGSVGFYSGDTKNLFNDMKFLKPTVMPAVPRLLNRFYNQIQSEIEQSFFKRVIFNLALRAKESDLKKNLLRRNTIWDILIFKKLRQNLGGNLRLMVVGSAPLAENVLTFARCILGCLVLEGYGQTECCAPITLTVQGDNVPGQVGPPVPCCCVKLDDVPEMEYYSTNNQGEICVKGMNVFAGYYKDSEKTAETIDAKGWLHTGDIGMWLKNGTLKIIDRKKHIFKLSQGEYIVPEKIENIYNKSQYVSQIFVYGESLKSCIIAIVIPEVDTVKFWALQKNIPGTLSVLCANAEVKTLILEDMLLLGKQANLKSFEQVKDIYLHPDPFSVQNGLLTVASKMKRQQLKAYFKPQLEDLYLNLA